jgi:hypothetical protein
VAEVRRKPIISGAATVPELSSMTEYPYFLRTIPSLDSEANAINTFMNKNAEDDKVFSLSLSPKWWERPCQ